MSDWPLLLFIARELTKGSWQVGGATRTPTSCRRAAREVAGSKQVLARAIAILGSREPMPQTPNRLPVRRVSEKVILAACCVFGHGA